MKRKTALTIAGSDSSGGAGIQADLKTMTVNGIYAMSAITALTAQNTMGVAAIEEVSPDFLRKQIDAVFEDIPPDAVKIGMVASIPLIEEIARSLSRHGADNIVLDPVMVATSGSRLIAEDAIDSLRNSLMPLATIITPNIPEAGILAEMKIGNEEDMVTAARKISEACGCAVLVKGGHGVNEATDILFDRGGVHRFTEKRINTKNTHGTGCTLSSAIAANLAKGQSLKDAVASGKKYLTAALSAMLDLGHGSGPMDHAFMIEMQQAY